MSRRIWDLDHGPLRGFYRDRENAWISGICSGIADRFNFRLGMWLTENHRLKLFIQNDP